MSEQAAQDHGPFVACNGPNPMAGPRQAAGLRLVETPAPNAENGSEWFRPVRVTNEERRPREHLLRDEVLILCKAARANRNGARDAAAVWIAFNHGLRVGELCDLRWSDIAWQERRIMVRRSRANSPSQSRISGSS